MGVVERSRLKTVQNRNAAAFLAALDRVIQCETAVQVRIKTLAIAYCAYYGVFSDTELKPWMALAKRKR